MAKKTPKSKFDVTLSEVRHMLRAAEEYRDELSNERKIAMDLYEGEPDVIAYNEGRSSLVSMDFRATVNKIYPSIHRTILGNDEIVEYQPIGDKSDEKNAESASDYINYVVLPESNGRVAIEDAIKDALKFQNGIIRSWYEEKIDVTYEEYTGYETAARDAIVAQEGVELFGDEEIRLETVQTPMGDMGELVDVVVQVHDFTVRRRVEGRKLRIEAVPPEEFLIHPNAESLEVSPIVGQKMKLTRSDLVAMGVPKERAMDYKIAPASYDEEEEERSERRDVDEDFYGADTVPKMMEKIDYYSLFVRTDMDDDGIAEMVHMQFAGDVSEKGLIEATPCEDHEYTSLVVERKPHQWEGYAIYADVAEVQKGKTINLRAWADNTNWQNNQQPIVNSQAIENPEAVTNPDFGRPIRLAKNYKPHEAVQFLQVPYIGDKSIAMQEYLDKELVDRTGVTDMSAGMPADALQNVTAKATSVMENAGIGQTEVKVESLAIGLKALFKRLLKLEVRHQDKPRQVRLKGDWHYFDPRLWNENMDATVNIGLGAGTRERDMMAVSMVLQEQKEIFASLGPDNPLVTMKHIATSYARFIEAAGLKSPDMYMNNPSEEDLKAWAVQQAQQAQQPSEEQMKLQAEMQLEQQKLANDMRMKEFEIVANRDKEKSQLDADMMTKEKDREVNSDLQAQKIAADMAKTNQELEFKRQELIAEMKMKGLELEIEQEKADQDREDENLKREAEQVTEWLKGQTAEANSDSNSIN